MLSTPRRTQNRNNKKRQLIEILVKLKQHGSTEQIPVHKGTLLLEKHPFRVVFVSNVENGGKNERKK